MATARNRMEPPVNRRLSFEAAPYIVEGSNYKLWRELILKSVYKGTWSYTKECIKIYM